MTGAEWAVALASPATLLALVPVFYWTWRAERRNRRAWIAGGAR